MCLLVHADPPPCLPTLLYPPPLMPPQEPPHPSQNAEVCWDAAAAAAAAAAMQTLGLTRRMQGMPCSPHTQDPNPLVSPHPRSPTQPLSSQLTPIFYPLGHATSRPAPTNQPPMIPDHHPSTHPQRPPPFTCTSPRPPQCPQSFHWLWAET